jgi:hypothetical protein
VDEHPHLLFRITMIMPTGKVTALPTIFTARKHLIASHAGVSWAHFDLDIVMDIVRRLRDNPDTPMQYSRRDQAALKHLFYYVSDYKEDIGDSAAATYMSQRNDENAIGKTLIGSLYRHNLIPKLDFPKRCHGCRAQSTSGSWNRSTSDSAEVLCNTCHESGQEGVDDSENSQGSVSDAGDDQESISDAGSDEEPAAVQPTDTVQNIALIMKRYWDGKLVKLVCTDCGRGDMNSVQGFLNHCRLFHKVNYASHEHAAMYSGRVLTDAEIAKLSPETVNILTQKTTASKTTAEKVAYKNKVARHTAALKMAAQNTASKTTASKTTASKTTASKTTAPKTTAEKVAYQSKVARHTAALKMAAQNTAIQNTAVQMGRLRSSDLGPDIDQDGFTVQENDGTTVPDSSHEEFAVSGTDQETTTHAARTSAAQTSAAAQTSIILPILAQRETDLYSTLFVNGFSFEETFRALERVKTARAKQ